LPQRDRSHKPWGEANGSAQCGKAACCVRRGGGRKCGTAEILGHSQTKGRDNGEPKPRPTPARQSSTLPMSGMWKRRHGCASEAPPDERGGNRYAQPTATAPHLDSTDTVEKLGVWPKKVGLSIFCGPALKQIQSLTVTRPGIAPKRPSGRPTDFRMFSCAT
jgi:hypothetical protein